MAATDTQMAPLPAHEISTSLTKEVPILHSNTGGHVDRASTGWMTPTPRNTPPEKMREQFYRDGYIWIKNVIPRDAVLDMREQ